MISTAIYKIKCMRMTYTGKTCFGQYLCESQLNLCTIKTGGFQYFRRVCSEYVKIFTELHTPATNLVRGRI